MKPNLTLHQGDNRDVLRRMIDEGQRVQSVVCDPPYGLVSVAKRFGKGNAAPAKFGSDGAFQRASGGFMGQQWDASGIERDPEFWRLIHDVLLPGGYCLAFSSPRTGHWMACAMEQAGFIMHPFFGWTYGSGFPKASNAARAIDATLCPASGRHFERALPSDARDGDHVCAATPQGEAFDGWAYGTQSTKPALEPIYFAQRPFDQKNGGINLLEHGVGAINLDGCRVPVLDDAYAKNCSGDRGHADNRSRDMDFHMGCGRAHEGGRHPANLLHDGSEAVRSMFPNAPGQRAKSQPPVEGPRSQTCYAEMRGGGNGMPPRQEQDTSAARFFNAFQLDADPLFYHPKAGKADRAGSKHPTVKPVALMRWLCRLVTPPGGTVLDPFAGSGTTGVAALAEGFNCILMEANEQYAADIRGRFNLEQPSLEDEIAALIGGNDPIMELIG